MKNLIIVSFISLIVGLWQKQTLHPLEAKRDQLMEMRYSKTLAALREKNNAETVAMLKAVRVEFVSEMEKLKPEYERWVNSLTVQEIDALMNRLNGKRYFDLIVELQTDPDVISRYMNNQEIFKEYRNLEVSCDKAITF